MDILLSSVCKLHLLCGSQTGLKNVSFFDGLAGSARNFGFILPAREKKKKKNAICSAAPVNTVHNTL